MSNISFTLHSYGFCWAIALAVSFSTSFTAILEAHTYALLQVVSSRLSSCFSVIFLTKRTLLLPNTVLGTPSSSSLSNSRPAHSGPAAVKLSAPLQDKTDGQFWKVPRLFYALPPCIRLLSSVTIEFEREFMIHNVYNSMLIVLFSSSTAFQHGYFMSMPDLQPATTGGHKDKLHYKHNAF